MRLRFEIAWVRLIGRGTSRWLSLFGEGGLAVWRCVDGRWGVVVTARGRGEWTMEECLARGRWVVEGRVAVV